MLMLVGEPLAGTDCEAKGADRRRGLRVLQSRPVKVFEPNAYRYIGGKTHDISATGLRIELPTSAPVRPGKLLAIHVGLSGEGQSLANRRNMIPARVVWVRREAGESGADGSGAPSPRMTVGVEFMVSISARLDAA
jgi:hypothetical protein